MRVADSSIPRRIIRSRRRTLALIIGVDATLTVRAPLKLPLWRIERFIKEKAHWIRRKIAERERLQPASPRTYAHGEEFLYLGTAYPLRLVSSRSRSLSFDQAFLLPIAHRHNANALFERWYRSAAQRLLPQRTAHYAQRMGLRYRGVKITSAQHRWGSCSASGNINFSWRLVMAPLAVIDYVVVHELTHLSIKNHSRTFWSKVAAIIPDHRLHTKWLNEHQHHMAL